MIVALPNLERRMRWSDSKQAVQKSPMLARLGPAVRSAIRSLCDGKRTLRTPYSTSSIYECAR